MLERGVWADVRVGELHLRLYSEHNAIGVQSSVFDANGKKWIAPSEEVDDIEQGKEKAAEHAEEYLKRNTDQEMPPLEWKMARSA